MRLYLLALVASLTACTSSPGPPGYLGLGGQGSLGGSGASGGGGEGGSAGTEPRCVPSSTSWAAAADCGLYVSVKLQNGQGDGSPARPYDSLESAVEAGGSGPIYLCGERFASRGATIAFPSGRDVFGGLDCEHDWAHRPSVTTTVLEGPANVPTMVVSGGEPTTMADLVVVAPDATEAGGSSIALIVDGSPVTLERCTLQAGKGLEGDSGVAESSAAQEGVDGVAGVVCRDILVNASGPPPVRTCADATTSGGGQGGGGTKTAEGFSGNDGVSTPAVSAPAANGGVAQGSFINCAGGGRGDDGVAGAHGVAGTPAMGLGTVDASGVRGVDGAAGFEGGPGQGGGGGGGGNRDACSGFAGASGGSGGTGGCGGLGGFGGQAGGSSIALISLGATVSLKACALSASQAGPGGSGADGQSGGAGRGGGSAGGTGACAGGRGGDGGSGGSGSGASGGHSLAIGYTGVEPTSQDSTLSFEALVAGGGKGGEGDVSAVGGPDGKSQKSLAF